MPIASIVYHMRPDPCRLMERLPKSLRALLSQVSQASAARGFKALPRVAAQHQAVQQELILGDADEWQGLLVGLLPSLKQVRLGRLIVWDFCNSGEQRNGEP